MRAASIVLLSVVACSTEETGGLGLPDGGTPDSGVSSPDSGLRDTGVRDAGFSIDALTVDASSDDAAVVDATIFDAGGECGSAADCNVAFPPSSVMACIASSAWSCIEGRCVWECQGGRSCALMTAPPGSLRCMVCSDGTTTCVGEACRHDLSSPNFEESTCARDYFRPEPGCFGDFAVLPDGEICSLQLLATGAIRSVLACGRCQMQFTW